MFPRILTRRAETFYIQVVERDDSFSSAYIAIKNYFDYNVYHQHHYTDWTTTTFARMRTENLEKGLHEILQLLLDKLQLCQRALRKNFDGEDALRTTVINACRGVSELEMALFKPATICEALFSDLRSAVETHLARKHTAYMATGQYYLDHRYNGNRRIQDEFRGGGEYRDAFRGGEQRVDNGRGFKPRWRKKCFVCQKEECWSTNHTDKERKAARAQFFSACYFTGRQPPIDFSLHLAEYEGIKCTSQYNQRGWKEEENCEDSDNDDDTSDQQYFEQQFFKEQCLAD